ncbi:MAG: poly(3-hydroxyalkanoate) depolymerase [Ottowia sp.]
MPAHPPEVISPNNDQYDEHRFEIEMVTVGDQEVRVGRQRGNGKGVPLFMFNGIGGNIELLSAVAAWMPEREVITFDVPGVGHSPLPKRPYSLRTMADLAAGILDHYEHDQADIFGISWGGGAAQQFVRTHPDRCRRLVLCATSMGMIMMPSHPSVALKMATPRRYMNKGYAQQVSGDIYGGDCRNNPGLVATLFKHVHWQSRKGYYLQVMALIGWTSFHWLHKIKQPTLIMAGFDDPLVPVLNARMMNRLIPNSELEMFDCGHLFLMTRPEASSKALSEFLDRA